MPQLSEKPRHGVQSWNPAPHPGQFVCNSRTAIGLQFGWSGIVSGTVVAPSNNCFSPNWLQREGIAIQQKVAQTIGHPFGFGAGISAGAGFGKGFGFAGTASAQMIVNPNGNAFLVYTYGGSGLTTPWLTLQSKGAGAVGGLQVSSMTTTNATQSDLQGYALDASAGGGDGWGGGGDVSYSGGLQGTLTGPFGFGAFGGAGVITKSAAIPSCSNRP
jgi:hypothetical protein